MNDRDWTGNKNTANALVGYSPNGERELHDYYATDPKAATWLMQLEDLDSNIWECACGEGHLAKEFLKAGHNVFSSDLVYRGFGVGGVDFLKEDAMFLGDIVTNPPYKYAQEFVEKAIQLVPEGHKVCMFLKVQWLEGIKRRQLFDKYPPKRIWVASKRIKCGKNGTFNSASMIAYAWYVWEKGFTGKTELGWFN